MCLSTPQIKPPPPVAPPPPPAPSATELERPAARRKPGPSELDALRIPLNPTGQPKAPRVGL